MSVWMHVHVCTYGDAGEGMIEQQRRSRSDVESMCVWCTVEQGSIAQVESKRKKKTCMREYKSQKIEAQQCERTNMKEGHRQCAEEY